MLGTKFKSGLTMHHASHRYYNDCVHVLNTMALLGVACPVFLWYTIYRALFSKHKKMDLAQLICFRNFNFVGSIFIEFCA